MLTTLEGTCREDGLVELLEPLPAASRGRKVLVTFLEPAGGEKPTPAPHQRPRFSFDEALALTAGSGATVSDAVIEERREYE